MKSQFFAAFCGILALTAVLLVVYVLVPIPAYAEEMNSGSNVASSDAAWKAVERIDAKIANAVVILTVVAGLFPIAIGLYEYLKLRELEDIRRQLPADIELRVEREISKVKRSYRADISRLIGEKVELEAIATVQMLRDDDLQAGRALTAYLKNEVSDVSASTLLEIFQFQRMMRDLVSESEPEVRISLTFFQGLCGRISFATAGEVYSYLHLLDSQNKLISHDTRAHWKIIVKEFEQSYDIDVNFLH